MTRHVRLAAAPQPGCITWVHERSHLTLARGAALVRCLLLQANEIDAALLDLLQQNIEAARTAGQEEPAKFMEKVRQAAMKFAMTNAPTPPKPLLKP